MSVNRLAWRLFDGLCENAEYYGVSVKASEGGATLVDAGIEAKGGFQAGLLVTDICMGGCAKSHLTWQQYGEIQLPSIIVETDHPLIATLGSQYAGWHINADGYFAIGSGPGRALALKPRKVFEEIGYSDTFEKAIIVLETDKHPPTVLVEKLAADCHVSQENLAVVLTPTSSIAGGTQISGRIVETGVHRLRKLGFDVKTILTAWGCAPIMPVHPDFAEAMSRTNDALLYGGVVSFNVSLERENELEAIVEDAPSAKSKEYGKRFIDIFRAAGNDFYRIDPSLFAPAVITVSNVVTGNTFCSGNLNPEALQRSVSPSDIS